MAAFEKNATSRRFYSLAKDALPSPPGGVPSGSQLTHTDTGDKFIYNGDSLEWFPFSGDEDVVAALDDIHEVLYQILRENQVTRAAVATLANNQAGGDYSTDDE